MYIQKNRGRRVFSSEDVTVAPEATDLLFEAEDVAELVAEVTGEEVTVEPVEDEDAVEFAVGEEIYTVEAEGDEEILESVRRPMRGKARVSASARNRSRNRNRSVRASRAARTRRPATRGRR